MICCSSKQRPQLEASIPTTSTISYLHPRQEKGSEDNEEIPGRGDKPLHGLSSSSPEETVITGIRATDVTAGLRRLPAGFYAVVRHSGREWRTENKPVSVNGDVIEWAGLIPIPSDLSATVCLGVYASFEFRPVLGNGEQMQMLVTTAEPLLERNAKVVRFTFLPGDGDVVSPCSSLLVSVRRRTHEHDDLSGLTVLDPYSSATGPFSGLEQETNQGHSALSRYRKHGEIQDLERSIEHFERALYICPLDHPCRAAAQSNMAMAKYIHCWVNDTDIYLEVPLILYRSALSARPAGHLDRPLTLIQLAVVHLGRFEMWQDEVDAAQAEALLHEAADLSSAASHENRVAILLLQLHAARETRPDQAGDQSTLIRDSPSCLTEEDPWSFCAELLLRFEQLHELGDLQRAISLLEASVWSSLASDCGYLPGLANLGMAFLHRFRHLGELGDVEKAISRFRDAVNFTPDGDPAKPGRLNNLGNAFRDRFERLGELSDLDQASAGHLAAVHLSPDGHPDKAGYSGNLGNTFFVRFLRLGVLKDLEQAIARHRDAVYLTPDYHPDKPRRLNNLGNSFLIRFKRLGELGDLEQAISILGGVVDLIPDGHPDKPGHLNSLGSCFRSRFRLLGRPDDIEQAITRYRGAVDLIPDGHPAKPSCLNNLGITLRARFEHVGELGDLEQAISRLRAAVDLVPDGHPTKSDCLANLGTLFAARFGRLGEQSDLEQMLSMHREAADLTPDHHRTKPNRLNDLGNALFVRFETFSELDDLEQAISRYKDAVNLTPDGHPDKPNHLNNLANSLLTRFERIGELSDLDEAIAKHGDTLELTPNGHPDKPHRLSNLGNSYFTRFLRLGDLHNLEQAISRFGEAVDIAPDGYPDKPSLLNQLGSAFSVRFKHLGKPTDLEQVISLHSLAACASTGPSITRFHASQEWIKGARALGHHSLLHAYSVAIGLLPQLAWSGLSLKRRYHELLQGADVVREAAAAALDAGLPETAVEWLEQGRSIVWGELFQLRSSYGELLAVHPDRAHKLRQLSAALEHASANREKYMSSLSDQSQSVENRATEPVEQEADRHRMLAIDRDKLLQEIRGLPGFERFLLHKEFSQLRASAHSGPVVMLNAANNRCDALIVLAEVNHVIHVPLPNFTLERSVGLQNMLKGLLGDARAIPDDERVGKPATRRGISWESILSTLWNGVVKPVLDTLDFSTPGELRRIFWCPTGPFVFLPIHAAGLYGTESSEPGNKVFDFVVSSYVPTLSILLPVHKPTAVSDSHGNLRLLIVCQPPSDGQFQLPGVTAELEHIRASSSPAQTTLLESSVGTVEEVLSLMTEADWVHFACHGIQDSTSPADSGLCLADRRRLKLTDIIALSRPRGGLAFLSACQTATGDKNLSDEAIHIAAGMLFAGYAGVIGTMWSISDRLAPDVARDVYEQLFWKDARPDYREAARALHDAVGRLRDRDSSFVEWLPFIHVGL